MDRDDCVLAIVLAAEHFLGLAGIDFSAEVVERARELVQDGLSRLRPLDQHGEIVDATLERVAHRAVVFEPPTPLQQLLRGRLILPEIRVADALFYFCEFFRGPRGVKDSSAARRLASRDPGSGGAVRRAGE